MTHQCRSFRHSWPLLACVLILVATWVSTDADLVVNGRFHEGLKGWVATGAVQARDSTPGVVLESLQRSSHAGIEQAIEYPSPCDHLRLVSVLAVEDVNAGAHSWQRARLVVRRRTDTGWALETSRALSFEGTVPWSQHEAVLPCPRPFERIYLRVELHEVTGRVRLKELQLPPVRETEAVRLGRLVGGIAWALLSLVLLQRLLASPPASVPPRSLLVLAGVILFGVMIPEAIRDQLMEWTGLPTGSIPLGPMAVSVSTLWHALLFALLAALLGVSRRALGPMNLLGWLVLFALTTETLQYLAPGRAPALVDLVADLGGIVMGLAGGRWVRQGVAGCDG